jgi:pimeloyl-ACP methyl ester carboxylesterase
MIFRQRLLVSVLVGFVGFISSAASVHAQIIQLPDCNVNPQSSFCQGQCIFVTPLPSWCEPPEPEPELQPVLLVPGFAASHNSKLILKDQVGGDWDFTPSVNRQWQPLIGRLEDEGYELNQNLFVVHYDWRKSNAQSAVGYLIPAINEAKAISGEDKVDIIAHSMGGLVTRAYAQSENLYNDDIDQIIFLGTPNEGAAGSYVAWEGGDFPSNWSYLSRQWIFRVDRSLRKIHNLKKERPPITFRTFFPSIKELLPINPFVAQDDNQLPVGDLSAQNDFLINLKDTAYRLDDRNIDVTTIAGTNGPTLSSVLVTSDRTSDDIKLARWRDGHPSSEPIQPDTNNGDQTVLQSSVHSIGADSITLSNLIHEELPAGAQNTVIGCLATNPIGDFVPYNLASAAIGVDVMSPIMPIITGPNGEILSSTENTFPDAYFDWDSSNPDEIKMLTIVDPPPGEYTVELTGTNDGEYTVVTSYADEDDDVFIEKDGSTNPGKQEAYMFTIGDETFIPDVSLLELTQQLKDTIAELHKDHHKHKGKHKHDHKHEHRHIKHYGHLKGVVNKLHNAASKYMKSLDKHGEDNKKTEKDYKKLLKEFSGFSKKLDKEISKGNLDELAAEELVALSDAIEAAL